jgi:WD40 repeat protein
MTFFREMVVSDRRRDTKGKFYSIAFGPDKKLRAAVEAGDTITLLDADGNAPSITAGLKHDGGISSAAIATDGKLVAVGGRDGNIILWDMIHGKPYGKPLAGREQPPMRREYGDPAVEQTIITSLAFSSDGKRLFSASGEEVSGEREVELAWWDLTSPEPRKEQTINYQAMIDAAAFSPNGNMIATGGGTAGTVVLWDVPSRKQLEQPWDGHLSGALSVAFSPDAKRLAIGTGKGIFLGDVDPHAWQKRACAIANRNLTCAEWRESLGTRPYKKSCADLPDSPEIGTCADTP